jgi:hypothetical protein
MGHGGCGGIGLGGDGPLGQRPIVFLDLRACRCVEVEKLKLVPSHSHSYFATAQERYQYGYGTPKTAPYQIRLIHREGEMKFRVYSLSEAKNWEAAITGVIAENTLIKQEMTSAAQLANEDTAVDPSQAAAIESELLFGPPEVRRPMNDISAAACDGGVAVLPPRLRELGRLWCQALNAAATGPVPAWVFEDMWSLFDTNRNGDLDVRELETLVRDLATVRLTNVRHALDRAMSRMDATGQLTIMANNTMNEWQRTVAEPGRQLIAHYEQLLAPGISTRAAFMKQHLDVNHDGHVRKEEFIRAAPVFLLPTRELRDEAYFLGSCDTRDKGHHDDEAGCLQQ